MGTRRFLQILLCGSVAATLTGAAYFGDHARQNATRLDQSLRWARQLAAQGETLALEAREDDSEKDPVGRAARLLSQGSDTRIVSVSKFHNPLSSPSSEAYSFDEREGVFEYSKFVDIQDNSGLKIKIALGNTGFLGARSTLAQDASLTALFALLFLITMAYSAPLFGFRSRLADELRERILAWITEAKNALTQLGVHVRELVRHAAAMATAAQKSRENVTHLRQRVHAQLSELREARRKHGGQLKSAQRAEVIARHLAKQLHQPPGANAMAEAMSVELHRLVLEMLLAEAENIALLKSQEAALEPVATDADLAFHSYDELFGVTEALNGEVRKTTETLLDQARLVRDLKDKAASTK